MKTMEVKSDMKNPATPNELGLVNRETLDYKMIRGETNEQTQRPKHTTTSMKTDKGTFTTKG